ncbi:MAG: glycosyltransferase family 39 protein [Chloroflexi bacterium]|nr:glycosyltransferase family 39 protein [Chloroflexota bacterium]
MNGSTQYGDHPSRMGWDEWVVFVLIVLVSTILRFYRLGVESIWLDEATSILIAQHSIPGVMAWAAGDIHPPLYYLILHFWLVAGTSEYAVRALSAVAGIVTVAVTYRLSSALFGWKTGAIAALLLAIAPMHVWYSQEVRMYALVTMFTVMATYGLARGLQTDKRRFWLFYLICTTLALYTHYYALFVLVFQNLYMLKLWLQGKRGQLVRHWIGAQIGALALFAPWVPVMFGQVVSGGGGWVERAVGQPSVRQLLSTFVVYTVGVTGADFPKWLLYASCVLFGLVLLFGVYSAVARSRAENAKEAEALLFIALYLLVPLGLAWAISQIKPLYALRYLLPFLPPYTIAVAYGASRVRHAVLRLGLIGLLLAAPAVSDYSLYSYQQNPDWRSVAAHITKAAAPGDVVVFDPRWNAKPFDYYAKQAVPVSLDLPIPLRESDVAPALAGVTTKYQRLWLVWDPVHYSDPQGWVREYLDARYSRLDEREYRGVGEVILYDLRGTSSS